MRLIRCKAINVFWSEVDFNLVYQSSSGDKRRAVLSPSDVIGDDYEEML